MRLPRLLHGVLRIQSLHGSSLFRGQISVESGTVVCSFCSDVTPVGGIACAQSHHLERGVSKIMGTNLASKY